MARKSKTTRQEEVNSAGCVKQLSTSITVFMLIILAGHLGIIEGKKNQVILTAFINISTPW